MQPSSFDYISHNFQMKICMMSLLCCEFQMDIGCAYESEDRSTNDKHPLLFLTHPLYDLIGALSKSVPAGVRTRNTVELEQRRDPSQGYRLTADAVVDFQMSVLRMDTSVQCVVQRKKTSFG